MSLWKRGKTAGPYIVGGAKTTLDFLSTVSDVIAPSGVKVAIGVASQIIKIIEGVKANRDDAKQLVERLSTLLLLLAKTYDGKEDGELTADIRESVARLTSDLDAILDGVKQMQVSTNPRKLGSYIKDGLLYVKNGQKIKGYTADIGWAMDVFQAESRIRDAVHIRGIGANTRDILKAVENTKVAPNAQDSCVVSSSVLPSQPPKLYGRDKEVNDIAGRIVSPEGARLAILGPGGIGKTALLLAVREHPVVKEKFSESRFFVRCEQVTSAALLIELIARSFHIESSSNDRMADVATRLRSTTHPTLLLLDNFETPWDILGEQTGVDEILCSLVSFPHVAILITMRSNFPPSINIEWSQPSLELDVLEKNAARDLYISIDPNAVGDESLDTLLQEFSYMPLAIRLMASRGRSGEGPSTLLRLWKARASTQGEDIWRGTDKASNVEKSIQLSIESNLMKSVPKALTLLSVMAMLPAGASVSLLPKLVPSIRELDLEKAKATLREATLMNTNPYAHTLQLLSPIRAYVLKYHLPSNDLKDALYDAYTTFITEHRSRLGDPSFLDDARALSAEETNLEAILPEAVQTGSETAIDAAIVFCWYQCNTRPRLDVIRVVVQVCQRTRELGPLARSGYLSGRLLKALGRYDESQAAFTDAEGVFKEVGDRVSAAQCVRSLGEVYRMRGRYNEARAAFTNAERVFKEVDDRLGAAQCVQSLGQIHRMQGRYIEAQAAYTDAKRVFNEFNYRLGVAQCVRMLGHVHRMQGRYNEAQVTYTNAERAFKEVGDRLGAAQCMQSLGEVHRMQGRYSEAQVAYTDAGRVFKEVGDLLSAAHCVRSLGDVHWIRAQYDEAQAAYMDTERVFIEVGDRLGAAQCVQSLGDVHRMQGRYSEAQMAYTDAVRVFKELGVWFDVAHCLERLGRVHRMRGQKEDARITFSQTAKLFEGLGLNVDADRCTNAIHAIA